MRKVRRALIWFYLLTKRLLKKPIFLVTLLLIPLFALVMSIALKEESAMVRVALYTSDEDAMAEEVIDTLLREESVVEFRRYADADSAIEAVKTGKADSAWGFTADFTKKVREYADNVNRGKVLVEICEQEENVTLRLARERLYGALIPILSEEIYQAYLADELAFDVDANRETVKQEYEEARPADQLIRFEFVDGGELTSVSYLSTPLRGIIAVLMVVCGIAAAMVFLREKEQGIYSYLSERKQVAVLWASCLGALLICGVLALIALLLSGNFTEWAKEIGLLGLYCLMCTFFCTLLAQICRKTSALAVLLPVIAVLLLVFCPVFFNHNIGMPLQYFLPTYYYLNAIPSDGYVGEMLGYIGITLLLCALAEGTNRLLARVGRSDSR